MNTFQPPYYYCDPRQPSYQEMMDAVRKTGKMPDEKILYSVNNHVEAASHLLKVGMDNGMEAFVDNMLNNSKEYKALRQSMPGKTPDAISQYQKSYPNCDFALVEKSIDENGVIPPAGMTVFHGGLWPNKNSSSFTTNRPLSTTFCPQVALRNAEWKGKAFDAGEVNIFVLKVVNPQTKIYALKINGTNLGHEKEILFSSGANLTILKKTKVRDDYRAVKISSNLTEQERVVPAYVLEIEIS